MVVIQNKKNGKWCYYSKGLQLFQHFNKVYVYI